MQKKNRIFMASVSILLCFVLLSTSLLSGIFARFAVRDSVQMDVAFKQWGITITDANNTLVETIEKDGSAVVRANGSITQDGLLAPGTKGSLVWLRVSGNPEVDFSIDFSGTIDFGTGFGLSENLDKVLLLMRIMPDIIEEERVAQSSTLTGLKDLTYPLSAIEEMVVNAVNGVEMTKGALSTLLQKHRNSNSYHTVDGEFLFPIYGKIKSGDYDGQLVKFKQDLKLRDETGKEIEYLPIIIRCVAYDVITDGEQVTLNKIDSEVLGEDYYCLKRVDNLGKVHYFADSAAENISTLKNFMNGDDEGSLNTVFDTPFNSKGSVIDRIYSVEWEWFYHYATEAEIEAGSVTNNRDSTAVGDYQTADLDTKLGEMIAKYPEFFDINIDVNMLVEQVGISEDETTTPEGGTTTPEDETTTPEDETTTPVTPPKPNYVEINWKDLYEAGLMRSQWLYDISYSLNNYTSLFDVTATKEKLTSKAKGVGDDRSYFSTKMYNITSSTRYEYTFEAKNNSAGGYAGVMLAYDVNGLYPYFAYGEFDNRSTKGSCIHIGCRKAHYNYDNYDWCDVTQDFTAVVKQTADGYGQYKVIYEGYNVTFCYRDTTSGEYVQLGNPITLPEGSKVCVGVYSCNGSKGPADRTVSLRNCVLTAKNDETIDYLAGQNISLVKTFKLKVATFDINKGAGGVDKIAEAIKASGADIIGLQKVCGTAQVAGIVGKLKDKGLEYKYYKFFKAINLEGGGEYGVAVISKYPIDDKNSGQINLSSGTVEQRILARAGIRVHNELINFFVTHLSPYSELGPEGRKLQFTEVANTIANAKYHNVILTGNFNTDTWGDFNPIVEKGFLLVNKSGDKTDTYIYNGAGRAFDNIVHSKIFTASGREVVNNGASDHKLLYATLTYRQQEP